MNDKVKCKETWWTTYHNWGKWELVEEQKQDVSTLATEKIKYWIKQKRTCLDCGYTEINVQTEIK